MRWVEKLVYVMYWRKGQDMAKELVAIKKSHF